MQHYLIHYGELALKNRNRFFFEKTLMGKIARKCKSIGPLKIRNLSGRILLEFAGPTNVQHVTNKLEKIFGLVNFIPCGVAGTSLEELKKKLGEALKERHLTTFAIRAKRADKNFPVSSQFVNEEIGRFVKEKTGAGVNLDHPATTIHIELLADQIFFGFEKIPGPGGLPVGSAGRVACLLSGGIDSPVAAWRMMKRGCDVYFIHFHSAPFTSPFSEEKALDLAEALGEYQNRSLFLSVPFGDIQRQIIAQTPEEYRVLLYRRVMLRIASVLAKEYHCLALVTGESLSQVASQTLSNLVAIDSAASIPVFRPLIGMDKVEIIDQARTIGTFEISIRPHEDCCSFMIPKHPKTRSRAEDMEQIESKLDMDGWVIKGVKEARIYELSENTGGSNHDPENIQPV